MSRATPSSIARREKVMSGEQYLRAHQDPFVREMLARYERGDFSYLEALEMIIAHLLDRAPDGWAE